MKPFLICGDSICNIPVFPVYLPVITWGFSEKYQMFEVAPHNLNCILNTYKPQKNEQEELGVECWLEKKKKCIYTLYYGISGIKSYSLPPQTKDCYRQTLPFYPRRFPLSHSQSIVLLQGLIMLQIILLLLHSIFFD